LQRSLMASHRRRPSPGPVEGPGAGVRLRKTLEPALATARMSNRCVWAVSGLGGGVHGVR
jgi:hypothetical protein